MATSETPVAIIMGSRSDWPTMKLAADKLDQLGVAWQAKVVSAHRTPQRLVDFATGAKAAGFKVVIAGAGGAAHLPGMAASMTDLPVLGVPVQSKALKGMDSLLSIVQMPAGVPVATLAIGEAGAANAGILAAQIVAAYDDPEALTALGRAADVVTFEFENVPAASIERLAEAGALVAPGPTALRVSQDRVEEKTFLNAVGAPTVEFAVVDTLDDLVLGLTTLGLPALLKTRREGYDGKGQVWIRTLEEAPAALESLGGRPAILEARASFVRELSVIAARDWDGHMAVYPLGENRHEGGVLRTTLAPATVDDKTQVRARAIAEAILDGLDYVGVLGVELFDIPVPGGDDVLLVNEIAPRVHNTGHWTQDGCVCDQFEQHIRAVAGWPLGPTSAHARVEMKNLLGDEVEQWRALAGKSDERLHLYGKAKARPGRKMAHVNRVLGAV